MNKRDVEMVDESTAVHDGAEIVVEYELSADGTGVIRCRDRLSRSSELYLKLPEQAVLKLEPINPGSEFGVRHPPWRHNVPQGYVVPVLWRSSKRVQGRSSCRGRGGVPHITLIQ